MLDRNKGTMIKVTVGTREDLKNLGKKGDTYDTIIKRLIEKEED